MEIVALVFGIASVIFAINKSKWTWILGIINAIILIPIFWESHNYGLMYLQIGYVVISIVGFISWAGKNINSLFWFIPLIILSLFYNSGMLDLLAMMTGVIGTYYLIGKKRVSWLWYIGSNILSIVVCLESGLYYIFVQYIIFMLISIKGYLKWK